MNNRFACINIRFKEIITIAVVISVCFRQFACFAMMLVNHIRCNLNTVIKKKLITKGNAHRNGIYIVAFTKLNT